MFTTLASALEVLMQRTNQTLGIVKLQECLEVLDNPQNALKTIHVAGTNGKGSTTDFLRSVLQTAGYQVGTFTSPHLVTHNDRIRINGVPISDIDLLAYINRTYPLWEQYTLSMFEIDMLISILYFKEKQVDYVVYEVGLGGRLDATNVIQPLLTLITNIGYDHMNILGNTLEAIAKEKAGIIKAEVPLLTTAQDETVLKVLETVCQERSAPFTVLIIPDVTVHDKTYSFTVLDCHLQLQNQGLYQVANATLAVYAIQALNLDIPSHIIEEGIQSTHWAGRFEEIVPNVYVDGAHNQDGIQKLIQSLAIVPKPWIIVFAALKDKNYQDMIAALEAAADTLILTEFEFPRAATVEDLGAGHKAQRFKNYQTAIDYGYQHKGQGTLILTGSLYFISEARAYVLETLSD